MEHGQDDTKTQVLLRNRRRHDQADHFSWEAKHPAIVDPTDPFDPSRYSLLIHEVSLLVGLAPDDLYPSSDDSYPLVPTRSKPAPLALPPTKSLACRKHGNAGLPKSTDAGIQTPSLRPTFPSTKPRLGDPACVTAPLARHRGVGSVRPMPSSARRQGQVFHFEPPFTPVQSAVDLDETFIHPREPPPRPSPNLPADRCSSLDRLEESLLKLEAHAPGNHRKSQSEERPHYAAYWKDRRPSLPPPRRPKKEQSSHDMTHRNPHGYYPLDPPPVPKLSPLHRDVVPKICPAVPLDEDRTPNSFMDMDVPCTEETLQTSFRQLTGKEKMKSLVRAAKTASRGVFAWGKSLTGSTKFVQEATSVRNSRI